MSVNRKADDIHHSRKKKREVQALTGACFHQFSPYQIRSDGKGSTAQIIASIVLIPLGIRISHAE
jgi:hypothetical protein